jgi:hypothetical protein
MVSFTHTFFLLKRWISLYARGFGKRVGGVVGCTLAAKKLGGGGGKFLYNFCGLAQNISLPLIL